MMVKHLLIQVFYYSYVILEHRHSSVTADIQLRQKVYFLWDDIWLGTVKRLVPAEVGTETRYLLFNSYAIGFNFNVNYF